MQNSNDTSLSYFMNVCKEALDKVAPLKQKYVRASNGPFMKKDSQNNQKDKATYYESDKIKEQLPKK